jgi:hypothetical protein
VRSFRSFSSFIIFPSSLRSAGEATEEIFVNAAEDVLGFGGGFVEADVADDINEAAELDFIEAGAGVIAGEDTFERRVLALDGSHGVVDDFADFGGFGFGFDFVPAGFGREPKDIGGEVFIAVFGGFGALGFVFDEPVAFGVGEAEEELLALFLEGVGDVFEEDEAEADVLVLGGVHVAAHFIGGGPELGFEAKGGTVF